MTEIEIRSLEGREFISYALAKPKGFTVADIFAFTALKYPNHRCLVYTGCERYKPSSVTFTELDILSNKVANWCFHNLSLEKQDCIALFMENRIEFVALWLGFCKAGVRVAFLNNTIKGEPLRHSIKICSAKYLIYGSELSSSVSLSNPNITTIEISSLLETNSNPTSNLIQSSSSTPINPRIREGIKFSDILGFIYTSGTTGLPKAVNISHIKYFAFSFGYKREPLCITDKDVVYSSGMPLYHSAACGIGTGMMIRYGSCQVIRKKFSSKEWLSDVRKYKATVFQYIGEICRYIYNAMENEHDVQNSLRFGCGNGLSTDIWHKFQTKFEIGSICEFYGATEGNGSFRNVVRVDNLKCGNLEGLGCVGKVNNPTIPFEDGKPKVRFLKYDVDSEELVRDEDGNFVDTDKSANEPGECVFPEIAGRLGTSFVGYTNKSASKKKMIQSKISVNGKEKTITYVRTGDLLSCDVNGWVKFVDRIGDTFRWKGENVSTSEVAAQLAKFIGAAEVLVYGVSVPGAEGRAGCAAVVLKEYKNIEEQINMLHSFAQQNLPSFACPLFYRVQKKAFVTGTFKHQKSVLKKEGIYCDNYSNDDKLFHANLKDKQCRLVTKEYIETAFPRIKL
eukprot:snap_masked-scaffold_3-processed-gene-5.23-mRNA-1 protein AED:0.07 eAED:0.10 QI:0/0/0/0.75/1/1/4/0/621